MYNKKWLLLWIFTFCWISIIFILSSKYLFWFSLIVRHHSSEMHLPSYKDYSVFDSFNFAKRFYDNWNLFTRPTRWGRFHLTRQWIVWKSCNKLSVVLYWIILEIYDTVNHSKTNKVYDPEERVFFVPIHL